MSTAGLTRIGTVAGVELWTVDLDRLDRVHARLLGEEERARAAKYSRERDRDRFVAGRAAVRLVLSERVGAPPDSLAIVAGERGKPALPGGPPFSVARSEGLGLFAVGTDREVGVDVERLREISEPGGIAARLFSERERAAWRAAGGDPSRNFLRIWTRKEAVLKALGLGVAGAHGPPPADACEVHDVDLVPGHLAALAIARQVP
jgi:4'-phosphopantetheinyl transferase